MADNTLSSLSVAYPYRSRYGTYQFMDFEESTGVSTAAIRYGDVVQFDVNQATANHRVVKSSTMANAPNVVSTAFLGIAVETSTGIGSNGATSGVGTNKKLKVCLATSQTEFWFPTKSSAVTSTVINTRRALAYDSTLGIFYVDIGNSTAGDAGVVITEVPNPGTDANNPVIAKFLSTGVARLISGAF